MGAQKGREASQEAVPRVWASEDGGLGGQVTRSGQIWVHSGAEDTDLPQTVLEDREGTPG